MEVIAGKLICIALSVAMLVVAYAARRAAGTWLVPASLYSLAWFLFTFIPLVVVIAAPTNPLAIGYILLTCIAFSAPAFITRWPEVFTRAPNFEQAQAVFDTLFLRQCFFFFAGLSLVSLAINSSIQGIALGSLVSNFFETSNSLIADRYSENTITSVFGQISNISTYTTVSLGGLVFAGFQSRSARAVVLTAAMLPSLVVMVVFGAKGMIFLCIAMFYAGTLVRRGRSGDSRLIDARTLVNSFALALVVIIPATSISFIARGLYESGSPFGMLDGLIRYFVSYSCAHVFAFSDWFTWYIGQPSDIIYAKDEVTGGFYTFMSVFRLLGSDRYVPPGVFTEYYQYGYYIQTNVYTMFRGLIIDYTLPGSLVACVLSGLVCNTVYSSAVMNSRAAWSISFYIAMIGFIYTSFIISLLIWNSIYPMFVLVGSVLYVSNHLVMARAERSKAPLRAAPEGRP